MYCLCAPRNTWEFLGAHRQYIASREPPPSQQSRRNTTPLIQRGCVATQATSGRNQGTYRDLYAGEHGGAARQFRRILLDSKPPLRRSSPYMSAFQKYSDGIGFASFERMMDLAISVLALVAGGLTLEIYAAARAPLGYQDELGFHLGSEPPPRPSDCQSKTLG
jgi:hypothetical protein